MILQVSQEVIHTWQEKLCSSGWSLVHTLNRAHVHHIIISHAHTIYTPTQECSLLHSKSSTDKLILVMYVMDYVNIQT